MKYDFIFAGFGLSGMSLLTEMMAFSDFKEKKILVIDANEKKENDRTWSFWSTELYGLEKVVKKSWEDGYVMDREGKRIDLGLKSYRYHTLFGIDYYNYVREKMANFSNIDFCYQKIDEVKENGEVSCGEKKFEGEKVFVSFFKREELEIPEKNNLLWQHFKGWKIKTRQASFNPDEFLMMDYRVASDFPTNFFYVLPFDEQTALIEFTEFSGNFYTQEEYDQKVQQYISETLGISDFEILDKEFNAIPMSDYQMPNPVQGKLIHIGTLAGYVKASSGYAFTRTMEKNRKLAALIMNNKTVHKSLLQSPAKYQKFDSVLLDVMANKGVSGAAIFPAMFRSLGGEAVLRFLDERSTLWEDLQVMRAVPNRGKFVQSFLKG